LLARASYAVVLADSPATALLASASNAVVLADARAAALLANASAALVIVLYETIILHEMFLYAQQI